MRVQTIKIPLLTTKKTDIYFILKEPMTKTYQGGYKSTRKPYIRNEIEYGSSRFIISLLSTFYIFLNSTRKLYKEHFEEKKVY